MGRAGTQEQVCVVKTESESFAQVFTNYSKYMSIGRVIHKEGGSHMSTIVVAGFCYAKNAFRMGGEMVRWNKMTDRTDIFYVEVCKRDEFERKWEKQNRSEQHVNHVAKQAEEQADEKGRRRLRSQCRFQRRSPRGMCSQCSRSSPRQQ